MYKFIISTVFSTCVEQTLLVLFVPTLTFIFTFKFYSYYYEYPSKKRKSFIEVRKIYLAKLIILKWVDHKTKPILLMTAAMYFIQSFL